MKTGEPAIRSRQPWAPERSQAARKELIPKVKAMRAEKGPFGHPRSWQSIGDELGISRAYATNLFAMTDEDVEVKPQVATDLLYRNYKEPLKRVEGGYGYLGTVATSADGKSLQCHICGGSFGRLGPHIVAKHGIKTAEYKEKFQLAARTSLLSDEARKTYVKTYNFLWSPENQDHMRRLQAARTSESYQKNADRSNKWSLERRNKTGNCPDQIIDKIKKLAERLGHTPSSNDFIREYGSGLFGSLRYLHGGYIEAVHQAGFKSVMEEKTYDRIEMLTVINDFRDKYGRDPYSSDFERYPEFPSRRAYHRVFGGIKEARRQAHLLK